MPLFRRGLRAAEACAGNTRYVPSLGDSSRRLRWDPVRYGEGRPQKGLRTAHMAAYFFDDIPARLVLSSTNPLTKNAGMAMSNARPHTTMSFTPIDRDLNNPREFNCNPKSRSLDLLPSAKYFVVQS